LEVFMYAIRSVLVVCLLFVVAACNGPARVDLDPTSVRLFVRGQTAKIRAHPVDAKGRPLPLETCVWLSSNDKVATILGPGNDATVTATGPGTATVKCEVGAVSANGSVTVRVIDRVTVSPAAVDIKMLDTPEAVALEVRAYDADGQLVSGRPVITSCVDENICRGDNRGQLWGVGPGESKVVVQVDEAKAEVAARVVDARSADAKPKAVKGDPMLIYEKMFGEEAQKKAEQQKKKAEQKKKP
jgi:hypothetical protein